MSEIEGFDEILDSTDTSEAKVEEPEVVTKVAEPEVKAETEEVETKPEEETTAPEKEKSWTFSQAMDEREKRQAAVKEADGLREKLKAFEKEADDEISVFKDEGEFKDHFEKKNQVELHNAMLEMSKAYAERELGKDVVAKAEAWYAEEGMKSPYAIDRINKSQLKFHEVVDLYNDEQARLDPTAYKAKLRAEVLEEIQSEKTEKEPQESIKPSLASKRSAGSEQTIAEDFEDILGD
jgi:hypothetical protein